MKISRLLPVLLLLLTACQGPFTPTLMGERNLSTEYMDNSYNLVLGKITLKDSMFDDDVTANEICFMMSNSEKYCGVIKSCKFCDNNVFDGYVYFYAPKGKLELRNIVLKKGNGIGEYLTSGAVSTLKSNQVNYIGDITLELKREVGRRDASLFLKNVNDNSKSVSEFFNLRNETVQDYTYSPLQLKDEAEPISKSFKGVNFY